MLFNIFYVYIFEQIYWVGAYMGAFCAVVIYGVFKWITMKYDVKKPSEERGKFLSHIPNLQYIKKQT